jgi:hypothetical protein
VGKRLYTLNERFFEKIDNEEKAYWLGFLYADGYITKRKMGQHVLGLKLAIKDYKHLIKFSKAIKSNKPIKIYKNGTSCYNYGSEYGAVFVISNKLVENLEKLGCIQKKSLVLTFPHFLQKKFIHHFIRGYFDGDGSVYYHKVRNRYGSQYDYLGVSICGTKEFLEGLQKQLKWLKNGKVIHPDYRHLYKNIFNFKLGSNLRCKQFHDFIYKNASIFLQRKKEAFKPKKLVI